MMKRSPVERLSDSLERVLATSIEIECYELEAVLAALQRTSVKMARAQAEGRLSPELEDRLVLQAEQLAQTVANIVGQAEAHMVGLARAYRLPQPDFLDTWREWLDGAGPTSP